MGNLVFDKQLNDFARKFLDKNFQPAPTADEFSREQAKIVGSIGERFLYHPGVAFKVYGENIPLAVLLTTFGVSGIEALLEQGALRFILWTPLVTFSENGIPGLLPLQSGTLNSKPHCDPEESAMAGLGWFKGSLPDSTKRQLLRKVADAYLVPPKEFAARSAQFGHEGFEKNDFAGLGLPKSKDITQLTRTEREKLCGLATEALEVATLSHFALNGVDSYTLAALSNSEAQRLVTAGFLENKTDVLFRMERLPNFGELIVTGVIEPKDIPALRATNGAEKFRAWVANARASGDAEEISKEYLDVITKGGVLERGSGKFLKTIAVSLLSGKAGATAGAAVGAALAGIQGAVAGAVAGALAQPVVDSGLGLLDAYFLNSIIKGWTPRHYLRREIVPLMLKSQGKAMPGRNDPCYCGSGMKFKKCCMV